MSAPEQKDAAADFLEVAVCQLTSVDDVDANLHQISALLSVVAACGGKARFISFPENALYLRLKEGEQIPALALSSTAFTQLGDWAKKLNAYIHIGSAPLSRGEKLVNASVLVSPDGSAKSVYEKVHLFDVDVEGHKPVRESDAFAHGGDTSILNIDGWKIGSSICYDLRFSELYARYARAEVDAILIPSAFLVPTGKAHWHVLTRARAIESQAYVLAAAQGGTHKGKAGGVRNTYGNSIIIDPWGEVLQTCIDQPGREWTNEERVLFATLSRERIRSVRRQIPMKNHRRL